MHVYFKTACYALVIAGIASISASGAYAQAAASPNSELSVLMKNAQSGDAVAQFVLGMDYFTGTLINKDDAQAAIWIGKAAEQGFVLSQYELGALYYSGKGVPQDYAQSAIWFRKAAEQGNAEAQSFLAGQYGLGNGVLQDYAEAYFWYDIALAGNNKDTAQQRELDVNARDEVASKLTPAKLQEVQSRATKWFAQHSSTHKAQ